MSDRRVEIVKTLWATPVLRALVGRVDDGRLRRRPAPEEWAIIEVVGQLADTEDRALGRVRRMPAEDNPRLEPFDREALAARRAYLPLDLATELTRFEELRRQHRAARGRRWAGVGACRLAWGARPALGRAGRDPRGCGRGRPLGPDRPAALDGQRRPPRRSTPLPLAAGHWINLC